MSELLVTVASYRLHTEAQVAAALLEDAGIKVLLLGDEAASAFPGMFGFEVRLQVPPGDLQQAQDILADLAPEKSLESDWENEVERNAAVWVCPLCGSPVTHRRSVCPDCGTARQDIKATTPDLTSTPRRPPGAPPEAIRKLGEVTSTAPPQLPLDVTEDIEVPAGETYLADDLARQAFHTAVISFVIFPFLLSSLWLALRLFLFPGKLSPTGKHDFYAAMLFNALTVLYLLIGLVVFLG
jgi:hypothetical protein